MPNTRKHPGDSGSPPIHLSDTLNPDPTLNTLNGLATTPEPRASSPPYPGREQEGDQEGEEDDDGGRESSDVKKPPTKKRRIDSSPPWKSATTQTPTSFLDNSGRRKSGRTNPIPLELLPQSTNGNGDSTRPTRFSRRQSEQHKKDVSSTRPTSRARAASITSKQPTTNGKLRPTTPTTKPSSPPKKPPAKITPSKKSTPSKSYSVIAKTHAKPTPLQKPSLGTRKSARTASRTVTADDEAPPPSTNLEGLKPNGNHDPFAFDSDGELELPPNFKPPKIKLKFSKPKPIITHPHHIPLAKPFPTFDAFLDADSALGSPETLSAALADARAEALVRNRIEKSVRTGLLRPENCSLNFPEKVAEPPGQYAHWDHVVAHALHFQRLLVRERKEHAEIMKRRNGIVMAEIRRRRPRTREEVEREIEERGRRGYKEQVGMVRRKWEEVTKEVERRRRIRAEEEQRLVGKEHLNQMLEHSTQLLEARRDRQQSEGGAEEEVESEEELDEEEEGEEALDDGDENEEEVPDEDNMTTSESESDDGGNDDENLTVEELRAKYAALPVSKPRRTTGGKGLVNLLNVGLKNEAAGHEDNEEFFGNDDATDVDMQDEEISPRNITMLPELEQVDQILLDDSDESTAMDSEDEGSEGYDSDEEEDDGAGFASGLLGFFSDLGGLIAGPEEESENGPEVVGGDEETMVKSSLPEVAVNGYEEGKAAREDDVMIDGEDVEDIVRELPDDISMNDQLDTLDVETATSISPKELAHPSSFTSPNSSPQPNMDIKTPIPFLLRGTLREYQHYGLDWLAGLYSNKTNGILADEMGLGKTIQTIALLAHLACEKEVWGPHLIVVPTSVILNWEMEFKKWAPGFKILTYYGSREQRLEKRKGWFDDNLWHVCITSYQLVLQDQVTFKRRNWHYLILDEAHNIKNFRSQRWQTLLNFKAEARLLITGTPLQNNLIELWSLLYFLMPSGASSAMPAGFANLKEFQEWFAHPVDQLIEGGREGMDDEARHTVTKLHRVLRPYLLRRLKADVEKQMPAKYEHIVYCRLSKRQRFLYEEFMSMAQTRETLASGNYLSIINCLMQLRKVCNHPDLFETRQIVTSFAMQKSVVADYEVKELLVRKRLLSEDVFKPFFGTEFLEFCGLLPARNNHISTLHSAEIRALSATRFLQRYYGEKAAEITPVAQDLSTVKGNIAYMEHQEQVSHLERLKSCIRLNQIRTQHQPLCGRDLVELCTDGVSIGPLQPPPRRRSQSTEWFLNRSEVIRSMIPTLEERTESLGTMMDKFGCVTPHVVSTDMAPIALTPQGVEVVHRAQAQDLFPSDPFHKARVRQSIAFPDKRLLQYDCGKLQRLDGLLRDLQVGGHRALIFTQMTKVLDILEQFLNIHGHRYLRLDGATKVEQRQILTDRFNNDPRILVFILSTRSGGLGINLTGADTVIFYDLDWNPAMDKQCQDRCHRIGQTRDVHIYRFVSEYTIESNILRKSNQKRMLDDVVIQEGDFTTDYFNKLTIRDMLGDEIVKDLNEDKADAVVAATGANMEKALEAAEDIEDVAAAKVAQREIVDADGADFAEKGTPAQTPRENATSSGTPATPATPGVPGGKEKDSTVANTPIETYVPATILREVETVDENAIRGLGYDVYGYGFDRVERDPEHIDDYMIRYMEWELMEVPVVLPDKSKKKKNKKGKKF